MKTSQARLDWREGRRRRAWELKQLGWKQTAIAAALGVTSGAVSQWLTRARAEGVAEGLRAHPAPGPTPKRTPEHLAQLPTLLDRGAEAYGFGGQVWTCKRVGEVIRRPCGVILISSRPLSFLDPLGPPVEQGGGADEIAACLQGDTARGLDVFQLVDAGEVAIGQDGVGQRPQVVSGLQLGGVGRQEEQEHVLGHAPP